MDELEVRIGRLLLAFEQLDAAWRRAHNLTANERHVITYLAADGPLTPTELSRMVGITTAGMSNLLDRLESAGFVIRRRNPDDGRRVLTLLTKKALRARIAFEAVHAELARAAADTDPDVLASFLATAETIVLERTEHSFGS